jgi:hypothetical protein
MEAFMSKSHPNHKTACEISGSDNGADEDSGIMKCYVVSTGKKATEVWKKHSALIFT